VIAGAGKRRGIQKSSLQGNVLGVEVGKGGEGEHLRGGAKGFKGKTKLESKMRCRGGRSEGGRKGLTQENERHLRLEARGGGRLLQSISRKSERAGSEKKTEKKRGGPMGTSRFR